MSGALPSRPASARGQEVYLHIGLPKTGTTTLQHMFAANRELLGPLGLSYPLPYPQAMFHAAVDVVGWHDRWSLDPGEVADTWTQLCAAARRHPGVTLISHEVLGRARKGRVAAAFEPLAGLDVHVVVTARDLARQVTATWQERIKNGRRYSFEGFLEREAVLPAVPARARRRSAFWREQDLLAVLQRWAGHVPADHVHVVVCPPRGADPDVLTRRFGEVVGVDVTELRRPGRTANQSLGGAEVALLRQLNIALGDRLTQPAYATVVKRHVAQEVLARHRSPRPVAPAGLRRPLARVTSEWVEGIQAAGYRVYGDLAELEPVEFDDSGGSPDQVPPEAVFEPVPDLLATVLLEIADLRFPRAVGEPPCPPPAEPEPGRGAGRLSGRARAVAGRLRASARAWRRALGRSTHPDPR